jgi:hypothetical protein
VDDRCLINTDLAGRQPAKREWGLRPRVATTALQRALGVFGDEYHRAAPPSSARAETTKSSGCYASSAVAGFYVVDGEAA